jgi:light-independent protochlorophyllide reductase subunit B
MQLTVWTYEGPPHMGAMRIAASMRDVHCVLHAPRATPTPTCCSR